MGIETGTKIADLNANWPLGTDPRSQGDDHLRLIKSIMQGDALSKAAGGIVAAPVQVAGTVGEVTVDGGGASTWPSVYMVSNQPEIGVTIGFARNNMDPVANHWLFGMRPASFGDYLEARYTNTPVFRFWPNGAATDQYAVLNRGAADQRYVQGVRISGFFTLSTTTASWNNAPAGGIINSLFLQTDTRVSGARGMYIQQNINGVWATVTGGY